MPSKFRLCTSSTPASRWPAILPRGIRRAAIALGVSGALAACDGGIPTGSETPPTMTRNSEAAELWLHVTLDDTTGVPRLSFRGTLVPGDHAVTNDTLEILGERFPGRGPYAEDTREYDGVLDGLSEAAFRGLVPIVAPEVQGVSPSRPEAALAPVAREGEAVIEVTPGDFPELAIRVPTSDPPPGTRIQWSLTVRSEALGERYVFGRGVPPPRIPLPELVLPDGVREPTTVHLSYSVLPEFQVLHTGTYLVATGFTVIVGWTLVPGSEP